MLSGGGARGAYQVGVLRQIASQHPEFSFPIITGVSAGAINAALLAGGAMLGHQIAGGETLHVERLRYRIGCVIDHQIGERVTGGRRCLPAAGAPST